MRKFQWVWNSPRPGQADGDPRGRRDPRGEDLHLSGDHRIAGRGPGGGPGRGDARQRSVRTGNDSIQKPSGKCVCVNTWADPEFTVGGGNHGTPRGRRQA